MEVSSHNYNTMNYVRAGTTDSRPVNMQIFFCENPLVAGNFEEREQHRRLFVASLRAWSETNRQGARALNKVLRLGDGSEDPVRARGIVWR